MSNESDEKSAFREKWFSPHHPVKNLNKPGKLQPVGNAATKYKDVCLTDKLLLGPDLLHGLIGIIFNFRELLIALTADIEAIFLQVLISEQDRSCLRFLSHPRVNKFVQIYKYQCHVFAAESFPNAANCALKGMELNNEEEYPIAAKNFCYDDFLKLAETPEEGFEVFNQLPPPLTI